MTKAVIQSSFHVGELAESLYGRVDLAKYRAAVALGENFYVDYRGGLSSRMGTRFIQKAFISSQFVRVIPFQASSTVTYVMEFGVGYIRFYNDGVPLLQTSRVINGITQANPAVVSTTLAHTYSSGDWVFISGVVGMTQVNSKYYIIVVLSPTTFSLLDPITGIAINSTAYTAYSSGGVVQKVVTLSTPYTAADLPDIEYTQNNLVMQFTHPSYPPKQLVLSAGPTFTFSDIVFGPSISAPGGIGGGTSLGAGTTYAAYVVATVNEAGEESIFSASANFGPIQDIRLVAGTIYMTWAPVADAAYYNVYRTTISYVGAPAIAELAFVGFTTANIFYDTGGSANFSQTPQLPVSVIPTVNDYPAACGYLQQRFVIGGSNNFPQGFRMSQPSYPYNFNYSNPINSTDGISGVIVSQQLNTIRHFIQVPVGLIALSDKAAWLINGGNGAQAITPSNVTANAHSFNGASQVRPIQTGEDIVYVQTNGGSVWNISYKFEANIFTGEEVSILSSHLFYGYAITDLAWAQEPFKLAYAVRNDGVMLNMTYLPGQQLVGWCHSTTDGEFESVCSVTEVTDFGQLDVIYVSVKRTINGTAMRFIERFAERYFPNGKEDCWCVDSGLSYDGAPATSFSNAQHLMLKDITGVADGEVFTATVSATGTFTLDTPASKVIAGLAYNPDMRTLALELGEPTQQGKRKKISGLTVRVKDALNLQAGVNDLVDMPGVQDGELNEPMNEVVDDLFTGDVRVILDPQWQEQGVYRIYQPDPYPVTILAVIPEFEPGDTEE